MRYYGSDYYIKKIKKNKMHFFMWINRKVSGVEGGEGSVEEGGDGNGDRVGFGWGRNDGFESGCGGDGGEFSDGVVRGDRVEDRGGGVCGDKNSCEQLTEGRDDEGCKTRERHDYLNTPDKFFPPN